MRTEPDRRDRTRTSALANVIFEAPTKAAQAWFVKHFGPTVNLGNIPPEEVIPLETLRLGLRGDTLKEVLLGEQRCSSRLTSRSRRWPSAFSRFCARTVSRQGRARLLVPEGGDACCSTCSSRSSRRRASSRSTRITCSPRRTSSGASRAAVRRRGSRSSKAAPVEDGLWETETRPLPRDRKGRATQPRARSTSTLDHRHPPRPVADACERAEARLGHPARALEGEPARRLVGRDCWSYIRERGLPYNALHDRGYDSIGDTHSTLPGAGREGRWAGYGRGTECGSAIDEAIERGFVLWFTGLSRRGQDDDREHRRAGARAPRLRRRPPRRRHRPHAPLEGPRLLEGGPRHEHRAHRLGRLAHRARRRRRGRLRDLAVRGGAQARARALVEQQAPFVEIHVATSLEECARRDPKGLYAAAYAGEIEEFTGVSAPYEEPLDPELRLETTGRTPHESAAAVLAALVELEPPAERCERMSTRAVHALPPRRARGGGDPHHARGRGGAGAARAALLRRQGLDRAAAARREGVPARQASRSR